MPHEKKQFMDVFRGCHKYARLTHNYQTREALFPHKNDQFKTTFFNETNKISFQKLYCDKSMLIFKFLLADLSKLSL